MIRELDKKHIINVQCGLYHSMAVSKDGEVYSWGPGAGGRLGLGYDEESRTNLNQVN